MYKIYVDGELVETVMFSDDEYSIKQYIHDSYTSEGIKATYRQVKGDE